MTPHLCPRCKGDAIDGCRPCHGTGILWADTSPPIEAKAIAPEPITLPARPPPFIPPRPEPEPPPSRIPSPAEATAAPLDDEEWVAATVRGQPFHGNHEHDCASLEPTVLDAEGRSNAAITLLTLELWRMGWQARAAFGIDVAKVVARHRLDKATTGAWFVHRLCTHAVAQGEDAVHDVPIYRGDDPELFASVVRYFADHGWRRDPRDQSWRVGFVRDSDPKFTTTQFRAKAWVDGAILNAFPHGLVLVDGEGTRDIAGTYLPAIPEDIHDEVVAELKRRGGTCISEYANRTDILFAAECVAGASDANVGRA